MCAYPIWYSCDFCQNGYVYNHFYWFTPIDGDTCVIEIFIVLRPVINDTSTFKFLVCDTNRYGHISQIENSSGITVFNMGTCLMKISTVCHLPSHISKRIVDRSQLAKMDTRQWIVCRTACVSTCICG